MTDTISDMLTRIRNASRVQLPAVEIPHSKMKESIAHMIARGRERRHGIPLLPRSAS